MPDLHAARLGEGRRAHHVRGVSKDPGGECRGGVDAPRRPLMRTFRRARQPPSRLRWQRTLSGRPRGDPIRFQTLSYTQH